MSKYAYKFLVLAIGITVMAGLVFHSKKAHTMNIVYAGYGLPEHGLSLVHPSDASFSSLVAKVLRNHSKELLELYKPTSVFVRNEGERAVVGIKIKWACVRGDGSVIIKQIDEGYPGVLVGEVPPNNGDAGRLQAAVLRPQETRFFSAVLSSYDVEDVSPLERSTADDAALKHANNEMSQYVSITVTIDGAIFDDGTFVGPDTTNYFYQMEGLVTAKRDVLTEVKAGLSSGKLTDEILEPFNTLANKETAPLSECNSTADYYTYYKKAFAKEILLVRRGRREELERRDSLSRLTKRLNKPWVSLHKV
jgi:hypothetical protein